MTIRSAILPGLIVAAAGLVAHPATLAQTPGSHTAIVGGVVIDGNGGAPLPDAVVLMDGARITAVGSRSGVAIPAATVLRASAQPSARDAVRSRASSRVHV